MARVALENVSKLYPGNVKAVDAVDLSIADQEFVVLVGPSGCGKSTTLRMIAGLEEITGGQIRIGDRIVNDIPPKNRDIAMVFQNYALYPHMTVYKNMAFALKLRGVPKTQIHERVMEAILRGDGTQAAQMMRAHVTLLGEGLPDLLHFLRMVWQVFHNFAGALIIGTIIFGVGIFIARTESYPRYLGYHYLIAWGDVHWFRNPEHIVDLDAPDGSRVRTTSSRIAASPEVQAVMADLKRHATRSAAMP